MVIINIEGMLSNRKRRVGEGGWQVFGSSPGIWAKLRFCSTWNGRDFSIWTEDLFGVFEENVFLLAPGASQDYSIFTFAFQAYSGTA